MLSLRFLLRYLAILSTINAALAWPTQGSIFSLAKPGHSASQVHLTQAKNVQSELIERSVDNGTEEAPEVPVDQTQAVTQAPSGTGNGTDSGANPAPGFIPNDPTVSPMTNCKNPITGRDNKCWAELGLDSWTTTWVLGHYEQCRPADAADPYASCCKAGEPFNTCFLRLEGFVSLDCSGIKLATCVPPPADMRDISPEVFYVAYNIYAINQFFNSWWTAVGNAGSIASLNVEEIIQLVNLPDNTNLIMDNILISLTGIFSIAPIATAAIRDSLKLATGWIATMQVVENAIIAYPQIGRYLFPPTDPESKFIQVADLKTQLVSVIQKVQSNLNSTLVSTMTDPAQFLAFASKGNFTASAPSLPDQANYLLYGFNTYLVSAALAGNDVHAILAHDTNPALLATNGTKLNYDLGNCADGVYNEVGVCDQWWYDNETNIAYGLDDFRHMNRDWHDTLTQLLSNYTTGELLLKAAYTCNSQGGFGAPVNVTVNYAGVNTACLSQLQTLTWDPTCEELETGSSCEFLDAPSQNSWLVDCGSHSFWSTMDNPKYCVPSSYLGPLLTGDLEQNELSRDLM